MPPAPHPPANRTEEQTRVNNHDLVIAGHALPVRLLGLLWLGPIFILSIVGVAGIPFGQTHHPQRPLVYVTASSLFRLERRSISALVVDSTTGGRHTRRPSCRMRHRRRPRHNVTGQEALLLRPTTVKTSAVRMWE